MYLIFAERKKSRSKLLSRSWNQDTTWNVIYVNATGRMGTWPEWLGQDLGLTSRWVSPDLKSMRSKIQPETLKATWEEKLFPSFYLYERFPSGALCQCFRVQGCRSLDGHSSLSIVLVLWHCRYMPYYTYYLFIQQKIICWPVIWPLMTFAYLNFHSNQFWAPRNFRFSTGSGNIWSLTLNKCLSCRLFWIARDIQDDRENLRISS